MSPRFSEAEDLAERLLDHIEDLVPTLLPAARQNGAYWSVGSVAGEPGQSLYIHSFGPKVGSWSDTNGGPDDYGDLLDLVRQTVCNGDMRSAMTWARNYLGLSDSPAIDRSVLERRRAEREAQAAVEEEEKIARARILWGRGIPIGGTAGEAYFRCRGIDPICYSPSGLP